jgi:bleomycin hydrolase
MRSWIYCTFFFVSFCGFGFPQVCLKKFKKLSAQELRYIAPEFLKKHNNQYSHEVPTSEVSDQCNYGSCWVHARLSHVESQIKKLTGKSIKLSRQFVVVQSLLDRIDTALENPHNRVFAGGNAYTADKLSRNYGLIPDDPSIWKSRINFEKSPHSGRLLYFLNARAAQFHVEASQLTPESKEYLDLQDKARKDMHDILKTYTGTLPRKFNYRGQSYTPKQFFKSLLPGQPNKPLWVFTEMEELSGNLRRESSMQVASLPSYVKSSRESLEKIEKRIIKAIQDGQSVTLAYESNPLFSDRETGILSLDAFNTPGSFSPAHRMYRDAFQDGNGHHAVDVVGVDLDSEGRLIKLKIKNSWGTDSGDNGYYHMYRDYFEHFVTSIYLSDSEPTRPSRPKQQVPLPN